jgi:hypothetical protein
MFDNFLGVSLPFSSRRLAKRHHQCRRTLLRNWQDQSGATRTPFIPACSIAFRTTPIFLASLTMSATLA